MDMTCRVGCGPVFMPIAALAVMPIAALAVMPIAALAVVHQGWLQSSVHADPGTNDCAFPKPSTGPYKSITWLAQGSLQLYVARPPQIYVGNGLARSKTSSIKGRNV